MSNGTLTKIIAFNGEVMRMNILGSDLSVHPTQKVLLEGANGDTYIHVPSANSFEIVEGGNVISMPAISGNDTLASLGVANVFTAVQQFNSPVVVKDDANGGYLIYERFDTTPNNYDQLAVFRAQGLNDADPQESIEYVKIQMRSEDITDGTEDGSMIFWSFINGVNSAVFETNNNGKIKFHQDMKFVTGKKLFYDNGGNTYTIQEPS